MTGQEEMQRARAAGFSESEIADGIVGEKAKAIKAGFTAEDVDAYYGQPAFDAQPVKDLVSANLQPRTKPAENFLEAFEAGTQMSVSGLLARGKSPDIEVGPDATRMQRIASTVGQMAGDLPAMVVGAGVGGTATGPLAPVGAMAGAFALPAGMRKILMDKYEKGEATTFGEFWDRFAGAAIETAKGYVTGAATGAVGKGIAALPLSPAAKAAATLTGEVGTMTTVGAALEGHMPNAQDFIDTTLALGFIKGSVRVAGKLREIYTRTGVKPEDVAADAMRDPTILQDLASDNRSIPKVYQDAEADVAAQMRRETMPKVERRPTGAYVDVLPKKPLTELAGDAISPTAETGSKAGTFLQDPYLKQSLRQEGISVTRPLTETEEMRQYAAVAHYDVFPTPRGKHEVTDTAQTPFWYRQILDMKDDQHPNGPAPWEVDRSLERLRETGEPANALDKKVLDHIINEQSIIRAVQGLAKEVPDSHLDAPGYDKGRAFRTAEEILQERNYVKPAEEMISHEPRPKLRQQMYILPKGRGPVIHTDDMREIVHELEQKGIVFEPSGKARWEENIPLEDAQQKILNQIVQHEPGTEKLSFSALYTSVFDNLHPIKEVGAEHAYTLMRLTRGIMGKAREFLQFGAFDFEHYKTITRGYEEILKPVKKDLNGFRAYMASKRVLEKTKQGIETGFDPEAAKVVVNAGKGKYEAVFQERLKYRDALLDYLEGAGIINAARKAAMKKANQDYVPFYRFFEEEGTTGRNESTKTVRDPIKEMKGSKQKIQDPILSDIKDTYLFLGLAEKNAARQAFVSMGKEYAEEVRRKSDPVTKKDIQEIVKEHGVTDEAAEAIAALRPSSFRSGANELVVFHDGERTVYKVDPKIAEAFEDLNKVTASILAKIFLHAPAGWLRAGVTLTPDFMGRNVMRDAIASFIFAGSHPIKTIRGGISLLREDTAFHNWLKGGGANATMVAIDRDYVQSHIMNLNAETGLMERALNVMKTPIDVLRALSEFVENATRIGAVRAEMEKAQTKATIQALSLISREATVDFGRHGKDLQNVSKSVAFFNPALQGIDRTARAFKDNPVPAVAKALASVTIPSLLLWYANKDDQEIQDLPRWQKDLFWLARVPLPGGDSFILRIPKAHEIGILFGTLPERLMDAFIKDNPDAFKDFEKSILGVLIPSLIPTALVPEIEQFANRSSFTGGPLVPASTEKLLPEYQYNEYTSETAKALGKMFGAFPGMEKAAVSNEDAIGGVARALTTPAYIENYVRQWTGGMGMYALQLLDVELKRQGLAPDPVLPARTLADIPFVKAFVARYPSSTAQSIQDFYSTYYTAKRYYDTINHLAQQGDPKAVELMAQHEDKMVQLDGIRETLTGLSQFIHGVYKDPAMSPSDKRQLIDTAYMNMIDLAKGGNELYRQIGQLP